MKIDTCREVNYVPNAEKFLLKLDAAKVTYSIISSKNEIIKEVHNYTVKNQDNRTITVTDESDLTSLDWEDVDVTAEYEPQTLSTSVTFAYMGIEETGTLVILSSPISSTGMNFLPDHHIVILDIKNIVETMEDTWQVLRNSQCEMPRTINLITGPSRTTDIERTIETGAPGAKYLHVILIQSEK